MGEWLRIIEWDVNKLCPFLWQVIVEVEYQPIFLGFSELFFCKFPHFWAFPVLFPHALTSRLLQQPNQRHKWSIEISIGFEYLVLQAASLSILECKTSVRKQRKVHENHRKPLVVISWSPYFHPRYLSADRLKDVRRHGWMCGWLDLVLFLLDFQALKLRYFCNICTLWFLFWLCLREFLVMLIGSCSYLTYRESVVQYRFFVNFQSGIFISGQHVPLKLPQPAIFWESFLKPYSSCSMTGSFSGRFGMQCTLLQLHTTIILLLDILVCALPTWVLVFHQGRDISNSLQSLHSHYDMLFQIGEPSHMLWGEKIRWQQHLEGHCIWLMPLNFGWNHQPQTGCDLLIC